MSFKSKVKHIFHCSALISTILVVHYTSAPRDDPVGGDPGLLVSVLLLLQQCSLVAVLPVALMMFLGLVCYNAFPDEVKIQDTSRQVPFVCVRTVTRGLFPELVLENVHRNMKTCFDAGLENFVVEVVTDRAVGLPPYPRLRETVVPTEYKTRNGTLFKARALQYCLEQGVNSLNDQDWVVHLDEETVMTPGSVRGIINFVSDGRHHLGQGTITYANEHVVNWLTTLADAGRVADDLGILRFQLKALHRLFLVWKGSFLVIRTGLERKITFDHGPSGSVTEDINFGMLSASQGYTFDFVEGEMWEKSTFNLADFVRQRARWCQGSILICLNRKVPFRAKFFFCYCTLLSLVLPLLTPAMLLSLFYSATWGAPYALLRSFVVGTFTYTFPFGVLRSFSLTKLGPVRYAFFLLAAFVFLPPFKLVVDSVAIAQSLMSRKVDFHIVDKRTVGGSKVETNVV